MYRHLSVFMVLLFLPLIVLAQAQPVGWRGDGSGVFPDANPPLKWSAKDGTNIAWKIPLPSWGNASPVVVNNTVFVTSEPTDLLAYDAKTGRHLWTRSHHYIDKLEEAEKAIAKETIAIIPSLRKELANNQRELNRLRRNLRRQRSDPKIRMQMEDAMARTETIRLKLEGLIQQYHIVEGEKVSTAYASGFIGFASSTPVVHQGSIFAVFGNGIVSSHTLEGKRQWMTWVGSPAPHMEGYHTGHAASPVLVDGVLVVGVGHLVGLDAKTGKELWRGGTYANFGSPAGGVVEEVGVVVAPSGAVRRVSDGKLLGRPLRKIWYTGPLLFDNQVYFIGNTHDGATRDAFDIRPLVHGKTIAPRVWRSKKLQGRYYSTPTPVDGLLHSVTRYGKLFAVRLDNGSVHYSGKFPVSEGETQREVYPSSISAGGYLYITSSGGTTYVCAPRPRTYHAMGVNDLEELRSSFFVVGKDIYARGLRNLYRISASTP